MAEIERWTEKAERFYSQDPNREQRVKDYILLGIFLNSIMIISMLLWLFMPTERIDKIYTNGSIYYKRMSVFSVMIEGISNGYDFIMYAYALVLVVIETMFLVILVFQLIKFIRQFNNLQTEKINLFLYLQGLVKFSSSPSMGGKTAVSSIIWNIVGSIYFIFMPSIEFFANELTLPVVLIVDFVLILSISIAGIILAVKRKSKVKVMLNEIYVLEMYKETK